jgi:hypothetical protein
MRIIVREYQDTTILEETMHRWTGPIQSGDEIQSPGKSTRTLGLIMPCKNDLFGLTAGHVLKGHQKFVLKHHATEQEALAHALVAPGHSGKDFNSEIGIIKFDRRDHPLLHLRESRFDMYHIHRPLPREARAVAGAINFDFNIIRSFTVARQRKTMVYKNGAVTGLTIAELVHCPRPR